MRVSGTRTLIIIICTVNYKVIIVLISLEAIATQKLFKRSFFKIMGCLLSIFRQRSDQDEVTIELGSTTTNVAVTCKCGAFGPDIKTCIDPTSNAIKVEGKGTALGSCALDCDTAYWEVKLGSNPSNVVIGVKRYNSKKPTPLTGSLKDSSSVSDGAPESFVFTPEGNCVLKTGDIVGVYWDQTDLPMLSFTLNGKDVQSASVMRIRPACDIIPAVSVDTGGSCEFYFDGNHFAHPPKSNNFKMIVCATSLI